MLYLNFFKRTPGPPPSPILYGYIANLPELLISSLTKSMIIVKKWKLLETFCSNEIKAYIYVIISTLIGFPNLHWSYENVWDLMNSFLVRKQVLVLLGVPVSNNNSHIDLWDSLLVNSPLHYCYTHYRHENTHTNLICFILMLGSAKRNNCTLCWNMYPEGFWFG